MIRSQTKLYSLALLLLASLFLLGSTSAEEAFVSTRTTARTEIWRAITTGTAGSATIAIMDAGRLVYAEGFGMADRENSIAVDRNTVFNIGSVSKLFAATSIMLLVDEGKIELDKPVTAYLPEFTMADERYRDITVRMLLSHSSGLPGSTFWNNLGSEYNQSIHEELLASLSLSALKHRPGELATYCNDGFTLVEIIVANVTGKSYADFLVERIFEPLDMNHTSIGVGRIPEGMTPAKYYRPDGKSEPLEVVSLLASGGVSSTAEDLCKFADSFGSDSAILSAQSRTEMLKLQPSEVHSKLLDGSFPFGLGWDYAELSVFSGYSEDLSLYGKTGGTGHYSAMLYTLPSQRISVAVIANDPQCNSSDIALSILSAYLEEKGLIVKNDEVAKAPAKAQPIPSELMIYEGYYCAGGDPVRIALNAEAGQLTLYAVDGSNEHPVLSAVYNNGFFHAGESMGYFATVDGCHYYLDYLSSFNFSRIAAEKLEPLPDPLQLSIPMDGKVWLRRNVQTAEETLLVSTHIVPSSQILDLPGYVDFFGMKTVKSADYAGVPVKSMRDLTELRLIERDGATWAWLSGAEYMPAELAVPLKAGAITLTIGSEGYNEWLEVSYDSILRFGLPAKGRVIVFGPENILYDSMVNSGEVFVPSGSLIELLGSPGDLIEITADAVTSLATDCQDGSQTLGEELYQQALNLEAQRSFSQAAGLYEQALPLLLKVQNTELATECSEALQRLTIYQVTYPFAVGQLEDHLQQAYPDATTEQVEGWIESGEIEHHFWDGEKHYFLDAAPNLKFRYLELMQADAAADQLYYDLVLGINEVAEEKPAHSWMQYQKPATYRGIHTVSVPRNELPDTGTYRIWFPIPINTGPQTQVTIESVTPDRWIMQPPSTDQDIGILYMEVPMEDLTEDLLIQVKFTFTHYEQRFSVDPDNVGEYDEESALFKEYTRSYGNTEITPDIRKMAEKIAGGETNPYLAARKIYDYIVDNVTYCFMPHYIFWPRTSLTESDYVHRYQRGDCGTQSIYFTAMCRSLGIPARSTGGWQLFAGEFGTHFWAEFYLPNYGWIPVDTSCAQLAYFPRNLTVQQRQTFIDYCFGNQDSMRCVVQKDADEPLIPQAHGTILLPMAVQAPAVEYSIPTGEIPDLPFLEHWTLQCEKVSP